MVTPSLTTNGIFSGGTLSETSLTYSFDIPDESHDDLSVKTTNFWHHQGPLRHESQRGSATTWTPLNLLVPKAYAETPVKTQAPAAEAHTEEADPTSLSAIAYRLENDPAVASNFVVLGLLGGWTAYRIFGPQPIVAPRNTNGFTRYEAYKEELKSDVASLGDSPLKGNHADQDRNALLQKIAKKTAVQMQVYQDDVAVARDLIKTGKKESVQDGKTQLRNVIKAFNEDLNTLTQLLDDWHVRNNKDFAAHVQAFDGAYYNAEDNPFKLIPVYGYILLNTAIMTFVTLTTLTVLDLGLPELHDLFPTLFNDHKSDFAYWDAEKIYDKLIQALKISAVYGFFAYSGTDGVYVKNANSPLAQVYNRSVDRLGIPFKFLRWILKAPDRVLQKIFGKPWETVSTVLWTMGRTATFGINKLIGRKIPGHWGKFWGSAYEVVIGAGYTVGMSVIFKMPDTMTPMEKLAKASSNLPQLLSTEVAPGLVFNAIRNFANTLITQYPRNDVASAQLLRLLAGTASGGAYNATNTSQNIVEPTINWTVQVALSLACIEYARLVINDKLRDRFEKWQDSRG